MVFTCNQEDKMKKAFLMFLLLGFITGVHAEWKPGEILVKLDSEVLIETDRGSFQILQSVEDTWLRLGADSWQPVFSSAGSTIDSDLDRWFLINCRPGLSEQYLLDAVQSLPYVEKSSLNYYVYLDQVPNDPEYSKQFAWPLLEAPAAWDLVKGSPDVVVAIIDSGTDLTHPDLASAIWINSR